ncbi:MAG TPA: Hsp20/alpha crystallin family protein [Vicinamibacterales bacterium]|nr:Hsp20/alpha crystallin family protein [Vicinamibacterales bacterium]
MDIHEYDDRLALFVDLPGVHPNQVEITLTTGVRSLSSERTTESRQAGKRARYGRE